MPGGDSIDLPGKIILCARDDLEEARFLSGQISNLMLFNAVLWPKEVAALFVTYQQQSVIIPEADVLQSKTSSTETRKLWNHFFSFS